eukprot:Filipodium_phascolosomae@DN2105_c0_g1_i1.p1
MINYVDDSLDAETTSMLMEEANSMLMEEASCSSAGSLDIPTINCLHGDLSVASPSEYGEPIRDGESPCMNFSSRSINTPPTIPRFVEAPNKKRAGVSASHAPPSFGNEESTITSPTLNTPVMRSCEANIFSEHLNPPKILPIVPQTENQDLFYVDAATVCGLLRGDYSHIIHKFAIFDCRFDYEYQGGHIFGAHNYLYSDHIVGELFDTNGQPISDSRTVLIFHCEFSKQRGPTACRNVRKVDRQTNVQSWPKLAYPEMYILKGGYYNFFALHSDLCSPSAYVPMDDPLFQQACSYYLRQLGLAAGHSKKTNKARLKPHSSDPLSALFHSVDPASTAHDRLGGEVRTACVRNLGRVQTALGFEEWEVMSNFCKKNAEVDCDPSSTSLICVSPEPKFL